LPQDALKRPPHSVAVAKASELRDDVQTMVGVLRQRSRSFQSKVLNDFPWRLTGLSLEGTIELPRRQTRNVGKMFHAQAPGQMSPGMGQRCLQPVRLRLQVEQGGELRMAASAAMVENEALGHYARSVQAEILRDKGKCEINPGGHTG
jgi:hypothetical protein